MKAFLCETSGFKENGIGCHETAAKMRAFAVRQLIEFYPMSWSEALQRIRITRSKKNDSWARQQNEARLLDASYVEAWK